MALTPGNVKSTQVTAVALAALAGSFSGGAGIGMRGKTELLEEPISVEQNSGNPWQDASKISCAVPGLQNDFATLATIHGYAEAGCQAYIRTANMWLALTGANLDVETVVGVDWEYKFNLKDELTLMTTIMTELSKSSAKTLNSETDPVGVTWSSGVDGTLRLRPGIKKLTIGGAHAGELKECTGSIKNIPSIGRLGRPLSIGVSADITTTGSQMDKDDIDAIYDAIAASDTLIYEFWNGQTIKLTGLFGGKLAKIRYAFDGSWELQVKCDFPDTSANVKINTVSGVLELVYLDNAAEA